MSQQISSDELAVVILQATAKELGKDLVRNNLERSRLMRFLRSERIKVEDINYEIINDNTNDWESDIY